MKGWNIDMFVEDLSAGRLPNGLFINLINITKEGMILQGHGYEIVMNFEDGTFYFNDTTG